MRWAAWRVLDAGGDPALFVSYVVRQTWARKRRRPFWSQVFGRKAVEAWLPEFLPRMREHAQAERVAYEASPERRAEYAERMRQDQFPGPYPLR